MIARDFKSALGKVKIKSYANSRNECVCVDPVKTVSRPRIHSYVTYRTGNILRKICTWWWQPSDMDTNGELPLWQQLETE